MVVLIRSSRASLVGFALGLILLAGTGAVAGGTEPQRALEKVAVGTSNPDSGQETTTQRPTSTPYSGDLSIFEYPDREERIRTTMLNSIFQKVK